MGIIESQIVDQIAEASPQEAILIRAVAAANSGHQSSAIEALRSLEHVDLNSAMALVNTYLQVGNTGAAVEVLRESARTLSEPVLRVEAARILWQDGQRNEARIELEEFLVDSGSNANLRHDALALLGQWAADQRQWAVAQGRFLELLTLDPTDSKARWAVILAMLRQGLFTDAVRIYKGAPQEPQIIYPEHARAWMAVKSHDSQVDPVNLVQEIIQIADIFPDDEDVQADAILTILSPGDTEKPPLPDQVQTCFNNLCERFFRTWPDSPRLHRFNADDIQALANQMSDLVRPTQQQKILQKEVADRLAKNTLPWAFLSAMTGRSYTEVVIKNAVGILPAQHIDPAEQQLCMDAAQMALDSEVVLDISAGAVLTELDELSNLLIGKFQRVLISEDARLDTVMAVEFLNRRSTSSWVYDERNDRGRLIDVPIDVADRNYEQAVRLQTLFRRFRVIQVSLQAPLTELGDLAALSWASAVQYAAQNSQAFWCDDVAMRAVARSVGVASFSTPALLEVLAMRQELSADDHESAIRALIRAMVGDFPPNRQRLSDLTAEYGDVAAPVANVFSRSAAWANFSMSYPIWISLVKQVASFDPSYVADWANSAIIGITRFLESAEIRREFGALLLYGAVNAVSERPLEVARCVVAVRAGLDITRNQAYDDDPLRGAVRMLRGDLIKQVDTTIAISYVSGLFSSLELPDRQIVLQALYE